MREALTLRDGKPEEVGMDPARIELIRQRARDWITNGDTPSLVLLVARKGVIVLEEAYGILRPSDNAPLRTDSIFPLASISKPFTASAVMCLVEDGLLSLKHPITDYVPELTAQGADQVLIADLLTHTSGYDDMVVYGVGVEHLKAETPIPAPAPGQHPITNRLIRYCGDAPLTRRPGEAMSYCNFGFEVLADVVRRVSGQVFATFVESRLFRPLGMNDSYFVLPKEALPQRVLRQAGFPGTGPDPNEPFLPGFDTEELDGYDSGSGGAAATARDLGIFGQTLLNGGTYGGQRVLSRASVAAMTAPQLPLGTRTFFAFADPDTGARIEWPIRGGNYGYGLFVITADDRMPGGNGSLMSPRTFSHRGSGISAFWADPANELVGVYLSVTPKRNRHGGPFWKGDHFQDMVHAAIVD